MTAMIVPPTRVAFIYLGSGKRNILQLKAWSRGDLKILVLNDPCSPLLLMIDLQLLALLNKTLLCLLFPRMLSISRFVMLRRRCLVLSSEVLSQSLNMQSFQN
jgi:hypothetical protein